MIVCTCVLDSLSYNMWQMLRLQEQRRGATLYPCTRIRSATCDNCSGCRDNAAMIDPPPSPPLPVCVCLQELYVQQIKHLHPTAFTWQYIKVPSSNGDRQ